MTTSQAQIKKINDMWVKGEKNKASIMRAVGVSRKTLLKYLEDDSGTANYPFRMHQDGSRTKANAYTSTPVQATQSSEQLTKETHHPRNWTWEEVDEYTRPDPVTEPIP